MQVRLKDFGFIVRGSGAPAGWRWGYGINCGSMISGRSACRRRKGTSWLDVLKTLLLYRLIDPGSEWRLHRQWWDASAMGDLLSEDARLADRDKLYRCLDKLVEHKAALFTHLTERWKNLFNPRFDVLLYDLTSTYFECDPPRRKRRFGYSRDKRSDCVQVVIALVVTPEGLPLAYEVMSGNTGQDDAARLSCKDREASTARHAPG